MAMPRTEKWQYLYTKTHDVIAVLIVKTTLLWRCLQLKSDNIYTDNHDVIPAMLAKDTLPWRCPELKSDNIYM